MDTLPIGNQPLPCETLVFEVGSLLLLAAMVPARLPRDAQIILIDLGSAAHRYGSGAPPEGRPKYPNRCGVPARTIFIFFSMKTVTSVEKPKRFREFLETMLRNRWKGCTSRTHTFQNASQN